MKEKINIFLNKLKEKRKIVISNPSSFEQKFSITLTRSGFIFISLLTTLLFSIIVYLIISFTSLRQYIPGYPDIENADKINETDKSNIELLSLIEKDSHLYNQLNIKYAKNKKIKIFNEDVLKFNIEELCIRDSVIFGNLPYNISSQILVKIVMSET